MDIKVSWLYFLDLLLKTKRTHSSLAEINEETRSLGITRDELSEMIHFYMEIGTVLYFPQNKEIEHNTEDFLILNPQWLLNALAKFIYDKNIHRTALNEVEKQFRSQLIEYEDSGVISKNLLHHLWKGFNSHETSYLERLLKNMLLTTDYPFKTVTTGEEDSQYIVVPAMLPDLQGTVVEQLPAVSKRWEVLIKFEGPFPEGIFERFVCSFCTRSGEFEGSMSPSLILTLQLYPSEETGLS